jgi:hypothetical protein
MLGEAEREQPAGRIRPGRAGALQLGTGELKPSEAEAKASPLRPVSYEPDRGQFKRPVRGQDKFTFAQTGQAGRTPQGRGRIHRPEQLGPAQPDRSRRAPGILKQRLAGKRVGKTNNKTEP